jgi:putative ABC transport system substrate-binding protein
LILAARRARLSAVDRRGFLGALALAGLALPRVAEAQRAGKAPVVAIISPTAAEDPGATPVVNTFRKTLRARGHVEGATLRIEEYYTAGQLDRFPPILRDVVQKGVDIIVVWSPAGAMAAKRATTTIPVVFLSASNPVEQGLVASLRRPGGNLTGVAWYANPSDGAKALELLHEAVPGITRVANLRGTDPVVPEWREQTDKAARALRIELKRHAVANRDALEKTFSALVKERTQALFVSASGLTFASRDRIVEWTLQHRLPSVHQFREAALDGALMSFGPSLIETAERGAIFVDKILKGSRPGDLPVEQPTRYELIVNLRTARALGLAVPPALLARADQVID